jgi:auxin efflux carrier family protein
VKPVLKLVVIAAAGAILARKGRIDSASTNLGHLTPAVLRGMSTTVINVFMPCLLFSKTVPSFTADNLSEVGVLLLTAVFYQCVSYFELR